MQLQCLLGKIWNPKFLQIDLKDATITIQDGSTPTPNSLEVKIGEGNVTFTENRNVEYTLNRGLLDEVRLGDQVPLDVTLDAVWEFISGGTLTGAIPTVIDALKKINNASDWVSTDEDVCRPYAVDLIIAHQPACSSASAAEEEITTLPDFRYDNIAYDLRAGTIAMTGRCNATDAINVRQFQSS